LDRNGTPRCRRRHVAAGEGVVTHVGRGEHFRAASWIERGVERWRGGRTRRAPPALRRLHEIVLDLLPGDHLVSTLPGGERVRLCARYRQLGWNPEEYTAFREAVTPGATVFDVGANLGAYTLLFAQWTGASGKVVAFEPAPASIAGLRRLVALNDLCDRVEIVEAAVSRAVGTARFASAGSSGANALVDAAHSGGGVITVPTTSLDVFCDTHQLQPDVIKIDVEGEELEVLRGARRTLSLPSVQAFLELHPAAWPSRGITAASIRAELASLRLTAEPLHPSIDVWNTEGISVRLRRM
jgi:FkbM family methyltransferase